MATLFSPFPNVDPGCKIVRAFNINTVAFGDGYEQRSVDGINSIKATSTLTWTNLTNAEADPIHQFLLFSAGLIPFDFIFPGETQRLTYVVTKEGITRTTVNGGMCNLSVNIRQVFDVG